MKNQFLLTLLLLPGALIHAAEQMPLEKNLLVIGVSLHVLRKTEQLSLIRNTLTQLTKTVNPLLQEMRTLNHDNNLEVITRKQKIRENLEIAQLLIDQKIKECDSIMIELSNLKNLEILYPSKSENQ